jgi:hypothetical protein
MGNRERRIAEEAARQARETAQNGSYGVQNQAREAHERIQRDAANAHSTFQGNTERSQLGSGRTSTPNPTDMAASGETAMVALYTVATMLGSVAAAALLGRRSRGKS